VTTQTRPASHLLARGRASAQLAVAIRDFVMPSLENLTELLEGPAPVMLDVGVGVAAMAIEYCRMFAHLRVVGLDVAPRPLELAQRLVDEAGMTHRIELRRQDVATLEDRRTFVLAWVPAPFVSPEALEAGVARVAAALAPGGWLILGHGSFGGEGRADDRQRSEAAASGGSPVDDENAQRLLRATGLERVWTVATPADAPALTVGRCPLRRRLTTAG
jgi:hypothetical protein